MTLCSPPYSFTPRQIRNDFTLRDLQLLADASVGGDVGDPIDDEDG